MSKCDCYYIQTERQYTYNPITGDPIRHNVDVGVCWGTRERDECSCGGDRSKCDFYPEVREKAQREVIVSLMDNDSGIAVGSLDYNSIIIETDQLKLCQNGLDITVDITNDVLSKTENIVINGYKFIKEKNYE